MLAKHVSKSSEREILLCGFTTAHSTSEGSFLVHSKLENAFSSKRANFFSVTVYKFDAAQSKRSLDSCRIYTVSYVMSKPLNSCKL